MSYKEKYLKYKTKYLNLQSQLGGTDIPPYDELGQIKFIRSYSELSIDWNENPTYPEKTNIDALINLLLNDDGITYLRFSSFRRSLARGIGLNTDWINKFFAELQKRRITLTKITKIHLYANLGEEDSIKKIENIFNLSIFPNLKTLTLKQCNIGDTQIKEIAGILVTNTTLTYLGLDHNNITNEGATNIASMLKNKGLTISLQCQMYNEHSGRYERITMDTVKLFEPTVIIDTDMSNMCRNP